MNDLLRQAVDRRRDELLDLLAELIAIPSETTTGEGYPLIVDRLAGEFAELGFDTSRVDLPDDVVERECRPFQPPRRAVHANLLARRHVADRPWMLWYTHLDTRAGRATRTLGHRSVHRGGRRRLRVRARRL